MVSVREYNSLIVSVTKTPKIYIFKVVETKKTNSCFNCYSITVVFIFSPPILPTPAKLTSLLPLDFVHVSFVVVPVIPSPHSPLPTPLWLLLDCS